MPTNLKEVPSLLEAMRKCTQNELTKIGKEMNTQVIAEMHQKSDANWTACMRLRMMERPRIVDQNREGQAEIRKAKLVELLQENETLRELVRMPENGKNIIF
jgi:hypothetical protein